MSPYLMRRSGTRSIRKVSRVDTPQATNMSNFGRQGNAYTIGYDTPQRAKLERRR